MSSLSVRVRMFLSRFTLRPPPLWVLMARQRDSQEKPLGPFMKLSLSHSPSSL